ncbi:MAG: flagellar export chaperone FlgN [Phycisphaerales bacterium]
MPPTHPHPPPHPHPTPPSPTIPTAAFGTPGRAPIHEELQALLGEFIARHETLLRQTTEHHEAIRQADPLRCDRLVRAQQETLAAIAELESKRQMLVQRAQIELRQSDKPLARLSDLARCAPEPMRAGLLERSDVLKRLMVRVQEEQNVVRVVSRVLLAHMEGLMRQVVRSLSHAGTYAKSGAVAAGAPIVTSLDLRL